MDSDKLMYKFNLKNSSKKIQKNIINQFENNNDLINSKNIKKFQINFKKSKAINQYKKLSLFSDTRNNFAKILINLHNSLTGKNAS